MRPDQRSFTIGGRRIGGGAPLFVVAEIGLNHGGSVDRALALVDAAAAAGADAIKLQTLIATDLVAPACPAPAHVHASSLTEFFATFELDEAAHARVVRHARAHGLAVMATPLSEAAVPMLERIDIDAFKIASGDLTWDQLITRCASTGRPVVLSTGLSSASEVSRAVAVAQAAGARALALLHCVSAYPVPRGHENLLAIATLARTFGVPAGLSDHSDDTFAVPMAIALGASIYERHVALDGDTDQDAIDRAVSSTASELAATVSAARRAHAALGDGRKECLAAESVNQVASRRALCASRDLEAGHVIGAGDIVALRPATGLAPVDLPRVIGARLTRAMARGAAVQAHDLSGGGVHAS